MLDCKKICVLLAAMLAVGSAMAQAGRPDQIGDGVINFLAPPLADPILSHAREIYVLYGCAYCHGVDLRVRNGEAADLLNSPLVGADVNGNIIGSVLRMGIPQTAKLSPMPQFSDLSDNEIAAITRWIHYSRQQERFKELMRVVKTAPGDAVAGKIYATKTCVSCHSADALTGMAKKYDAATLKQAVLHPAFLDATQSFKVDALHDTAMATARQKHGSLLENYSYSDVSNLIAYLQSLK